MSMKLGISFEEVNEMDPVRKAFYFYNWMADKNDKNEMIKDLGLLIGSFIDVEKVKNILGMNANKRISSDEDFDESTKMVKEIKSLDLPDLKKSRNRPRGING